MLTLPRLVAVTMTDAVNMPAPSLLGADTITSALHTAPRAAAAVGGRLSCAGVGGACLHGHTDGLKSACPVSQGCRVATPAGTGCMAMLGLLAGALPHRGTVT